jgi:hypothetical protein
MASKTKRTMGTWSQIDTIISLFLYLLLCLDLEVRRAELLEQYHSNNGTVTRYISIKMLALKWHLEGRRKVVCMRFQRRGLKIQLIIMVRSLLLHMTLIGCLLELRLRLRPP